MNPDEARKLLGGYATGSLTDQERISLFEAALDDQELFDQLAEEDALRELIDGSGVRDRLVTTLTPKPQSSPSWAWLWKPWPLTGFVGAVAVAFILWSALSRMSTTPVAQQPKLATIASTPAQQPVVVAENRNDQSADLESRREAPASPAPGGPQAKVKGIPTTSQPTANAPTIPPTVAGVTAPLIAAQPIGAPQAALERDNTSARADTAPSKAATAPATTYDAATTIVINGAPSNGVIAAQAPTPPPAPVKPSAIAGFARGAPGAGAAKGGSGGTVVEARASLATQPVQFGFSYQVSQGSLQVTPNSAGWLTIRGVGDGPSVVVFAPGEVPAGSALKFDIPGSAQRLTIEFAVTAGSSVGTVDRRTELQGAAILANPTENSHLAISIPAR